MPRESLKATLDELHAHLTERDFGLDDEARDLLRRVSTDIEEVLDLDAEASRDVGAADSRVQTGIQTAVEALEAEHPQLVTLLNRAAELLAALGI